MPVDEKDQKIEQLQDALYHAWYSWNSGEISNDRIAAKVKAGLTGYAPYEKRRRSIEGNG